MKTTYLIIKQYFTNFLFFGTPLAFGLNHTITVCKGIDMHICLLNSTSLFQHVVMEYLSGLGHKVYATDSLHDLHNIPDVFIIEATPTANDLTQLQKIHQRYPYAPILLVHDVPVLLRLPEAHKCGIQAYLRKPISLSELDMALWQVSRKNEPITGNP